MHGEPAAASLADLNASLWNANAQIVAADFFDSDQ
jgi:hypothetical protein